MSDSITCAQLSSSTCHHCITLNTIMSTWFSVDCWPSYCICKVKLCGISSCTVMKILLNSCVVACVKSIVVSELCSSTSCLICTAVFDSTYLFTRFCTCLCTYSDLVRIYSPAYCCIFVLLYILNQIMWSGLLFLFGYCLGNISAIWWFHGLQFLLTS